MGGKKKKTTIGYKYYMGLFMGLCRGPVDAIRQIRVGDKTAWSGHATSNSSITISKPDLFGGEEQEGGIDGTLQIMLGARNQPRNESLAAMLGGLVSAFRGVTTTFFDGLVCAMSPYPKEWSYLVQKTKAGWHKDECWYPAKCEIVLLGGEVQLLGSGWEYCIENFTEPNTVWNNFTVPTSGWAQGGEMPFDTNGMLGGPYWTPARSNIWLRRKMQVKALGLTLNIGADNGCVVWVDGVQVGASNPTNENISNNQNNPVSFEFGAVGTVEVLVKAYAEINNASESGNIVSVSFSGGSLIAMNPAHILRRLYTDPSIGRGLSADLRLDEESWTAAADTFFNEGLGLCMKWSRSGSVANFAGEVINHAGAAVYTSRKTGKIVLKAIRGDYAVNDLPLFTPDTGLLGFDDDVASAQTSGINEIVVNWTNVLEKTDAAVREKNLGAIMAAGGVAVTESVDYPGIPTESLARRIARRDLKAKSGFIKRLTVRLDRRGRNIMPGHVFRISDPTRGIENMVLRAGRVEFGTITDGAITVTALQDVFGLPATVYRDPEENGYVPPDTIPRAPEFQALMEVPYRDLTQAFSAADLSALSDDAGYLHAMAAKPAGLAESFQLLTRVDPADYAVVADMGAWCPGGALAAAIGPLDTSIALLRSSGLDTLAIGTAALIGSEIVRIDAVDVSTATLTVGRGCVDTVPVEHAAGIPVLCYDSWGADDRTEYVFGVTVDVKILTRTSSGMLDAGAASLNSETFNARAVWPYPPANVTVNGVRYPVTVTGEITLSWSHRDRITQSDRLLDSTQESVGPEPGTTYTVEFYAELGDTPLHRESNIQGRSSTAWTPPSPGSYRIELWSERQGFRCWQHFVHVVNSDHSVDLVSEYLDAAELTHDWSHLTGWTSTGVQVVNNRLYGISGGNPVAAAKEFPVATTETVKLTAEIVIAGTNSGSQYVGLNFGGPNHGVIASLPNFIGLGVGSAARTPDRYIGANFTGVTTGAVKLDAATLSGTYRATVVADPENISLVLQRQDGQVEYSAMIPRSAAPNGGEVTSIVVWNGSTNGASGHYIKAIGAKKSLTPFRTKSNAAGTIEGNTGFVLHRKGGADSWRISLPPVMDGMSPTPVVVFFHQAGTGNRNSPISEARWGALRQALLAAGYAIVSADDVGDRWGNQASIDNYRDLVRWTQSKVYAGKVFLLGCSMGGLPALNSVKQKSIYPIGAVQLICPVCDLVAMRSDSRFTAAIDAAWGSNSDATLVTNSEGYSPIAADPEAFRRTAYRFNVGDPDTYVPPAMHTYAFEPRVRDAALFTQVNVISNGHLHEEQYDAANIVAFFNSYR